MKNHSLYLSLCAGLMLACQEAPVESRTAATQSLNFEQWPAAQANADSSAYWREFELAVPAAGRYRLSITGLSLSGDSVWLEDYIDNPDGRQYDLTGWMPFGSQAEEQRQGRDGLPLDSGLHRMRLHHRQADFEPLRMELSLMQPHRSSPQSLVQKMDGEDWKLVWSDEFEGSGLPDSTKWTYNIGDWGWGNREEQYYTAHRLENARQENGALIITALRNETRPGWTSARLTTQGKVAFTYGKIEFRAKVPMGRGTWAAGWLLGESYRDELSWPYCGEIDVLECVGYEMDSIGNGYNHASCHTRAFYFKQGNQITAKTAVENMNQAWHNYSIEWYPDSIIAFVDGRRYYKYDQKGSNWEWPFDEGQNIILNLAIGGGWGGREGVDPALQKQEYILDYVRVYAKD